MWRGWRGEGRGGEDGDGDESVGVERMERRE
jgi:hypothetical protein